MRLPPRADLLAPLGRLVESHRVLQGWSQSQLASFCRVSQNTVGNLEAARHRPMQRHLAAILQTLRTDEDGTAGLSLPVLRAPGFSPTRFAEEAHRVVRRGGLLDPAWVFVRPADAGSWAIRCSRDEVRAAELQAPLKELLSVLDQGPGAGIEQLLVLGPGGPLQVPELAREAAARTALASIWLLDTSPVLLQHAERSVGTVLEGAANLRRGRRRWGSHLYEIGLQALCIDYRDVPTMKRLFGTLRPHPFGRLVVLSSGALDHATDDWRDLGAAAALTEQPGDLLLLEHRVAPADDAPDPMERARSEWTAFFLQEAARWVNVKLTGSLRTTEPVVEAVLAPSAMAGVSGEDLSARVRTAQGEESEIRLHWRRAYEPAALDHWLSAHGLRLRGRWPYRYGSRHWALYERALPEEQP